MGMGPMRVSDNNILKESFTNVTLRPSRWYVLRSVVAHCAGLEIKLPATSQTNVTAIGLCNLGVFTN